MGLFTFIMKKAVPIPKLLNYESYAFIGPHPDDIEVGCAPTVAKLIAMGKRVCFIIATNGHYGTQDVELSKEKLVKIREQEAIRSAKILGVEDVRFLGFPDGGNYRVEDLKDKIAIELAKFKPDIIFTCDNHTKSETHPDHIKTGQATETAMLYCGFEVMMRDLGVHEAANPKGIAYYYTDKPNTYVNVSKYMNLKKKALEEHKSQFLCDEKAMNDFKMLNIYFKLQGVRYGMRRFSRYADAYRVLNTLHTHCAPDASKF